MTTLTYRSFLTRLLSILACVFVLHTASAETGAIKIGIVVMHGKGGSPTKHVSELASALEAHGYLVANLEMPWSGRRDYDVDVEAADAEVEQALGSLRQQGAQKVFVAGHSQGGLFALHYGDRHLVDGIIAIAPGGNVGSTIAKEKLGEYVDSARKLIVQGKGGEKTRFADFEGSKGMYPLITTPAIYLSWFDPQGAMNQITAEQNINPAIPVLFIAPSNDYPGLRKVKETMFDRLPKNRRTKLYEPSSSHLDAPSASENEIIEWTSAIANNRQEWVRPEFSERF
jgi:pimeloyl-ACP methyl ester carboxylesterase